MGGNTQVQDWSGAAVLNAASMHDFIRCISTFGVFMKAPCPWKYVVGWELSTFPFKIVRRRETLKTLYVF